MIAIVIPYYKFDFFEETLQSLAEQTDKRFNVYIGNDAAKASPEKVLSKFKEAFQFQYREFEYNLGGTSLVKQWERCLAMKEDEPWTMLLCDDDMLHPNCIADFYKNLEEIEQAGTSAVRFSSIIVDENRKVLADTYTHPKLEQAVDFLMRKQQGGTRSSLSEYIYRSNKLDTVKFKDFPLAWHSDLLAVLEFSDFKTIYTINSSCVYFRFSRYNISGKKDNLKDKNIASFEFYYYLLTNCTEYFNKWQLEVLFNQLEKVFLDNKKSGYFMKNLTALYFRRSAFKRLIFFMYKYIKSILKRR